MKRVIRANQQNKVIFENANFKLVKVRGIGINDTPWTGLDVITKDGSLAAKHVVEIRLNYVGNPSYNGQPVVQDYRDAYVAHGMRMRSDTLAETREYIEVLEDAIDFAEQVNEYIANEW